MASRRRTLDELRRDVQAGPPYRRGLLKELQEDDRAGARALYERLRGRTLARRREKYRLKRMLEAEEQAMELGFTRVAGVDEAGRGPIAGPIVAAAVILNGPIDGVNDSKLLLEEARERLCEVIHAEAAAVGVAVVEPDEIDRIGIQSANYAAMARAANALTPAADYLLVDGFPIRGCIHPQRHIIGGDRKSQSIAAASIVAKVTRDRIMTAHDKDYPGYGFAQHKGYTTREHLDIVQRLGPSPLHRNSFSPFTWQAAAEQMLIFEE